MRLLLVALILAPALALAGPAPRDGWVVIETPHTYDALIDRVKKAAKANGLGVVTQAGPTGAAKARGIEIPGNRVIGLFNNKFAVAMLRASLAAMIEAPVRVYVTENADGTAALSYKRPSHVFAPYADDGPEVARIAAELDERFAAVARDAVK